VGGADCPVGLVGIGPTAVEPTITSAGGARNTSTQPTDVTPMDEPLEGAVGGSWAERSSSSEVKIPEIGVPLSPLSAEPDEDSTDGEIVSDEPAAIEPLVVVAHKASPGTAARRHRSAKRDRRRLGSTQSASPPARKK
jgi:hypothetical protein